MMYILQQGVNVCRWVNDFDPQNVNMVDLLLPNDLKPLNDHSKTLVNEFPKLDQVAELHLRKFKIRGAVGGGANPGSVGLTAGETSQSVVRDFSPHRLQNLSAERAALLS